MTNEQIIFNESIELMKAGVLAGTGRVIILKLTDKDGNEKEEKFQEPEPIHTYSGWKSLGFQVKKGEKSKIQFPVWTYRKGKEAVLDDDGNETEPGTNGKMYLNKAYFFTAAQVEKINR